MSRYSDSPNDWFSDDLPYETEMRFSHGTQCNKKGESSDHRGRLFVRRGSDGYAWYCHNCGESGIKRSSASEQIRNRQTQQAGEKSKVCELRDNFQFSPINKAGRSWLNKYQLTEEEVFHNIPGMLIWKSESQARLVLGIFDNRGVETGLQLRQVESNNGAKYKTHIFNDERCFAWHKHGRNDRTDSITVVEDIISGIKVSRKEDAVSLLGSPARIPQELLELISEQGYQHINIWLDPNKRKTAINYMKHITSVYGLSAQVILSDADPKDCL